MRLSESFRAGRRLLIAGLLLSSAAAGQTPVEVGLAPRIANYTIDVTLDPDERTLAAKQRVRWTNTRAVATRELWFHLYWNGWRNNRSTWMLEDRFRGRSDRGDEIGEEDWGWLSVDSAHWVGDDGAILSDLAAAARFASPDDANPDDRTVWVLMLPREVAPGETVEIDLAWRAKIPRTFARTGYRGDFFFIAHWFPKLGVYEEDGRWSCHQYHAATEFYSDYGVYDVAITLPERFVVGATGREVGRETGDHGVTHRYRQSDVHAFTWTASPDYQVREERFEAEGLPPVDMRLLIQPEHRRQASRHFAATRAALELYGRWYGPYPYGHVTVVDPAFGSGAGGMEYPTIFTAGTRLFNPVGGGSPEGVTIHEAGHQFWYGIVGNDEFEHAWLDEGLNTFSTARVYAETFGEEYFVKRYLVPPGTEQRGFLPLLWSGLPKGPELFGERLDSYRSAATADAPARPTYLYHPETASRITYSKTALWLGTLERHLGWPTLRQILSDFFAQSKYRHPAPAELFAIANEVSGQDLSWFFDQVHGSAVAFDYAVSAARSAPTSVEGFVEEGEELIYVGPPRGDGVESTRYRTEVVVRREGEGVFPVEVLMVFDDGTELRKSWDGEYRWRMFVEERDARLEYAIVDPDRVLLLDLDYTNNSRLVEPDGRLAAVKWAGQWMIWFQDYLSTLSFFA